MVGTFGGRSGLLVRVKGETKYSKQIEGDRANYYWPVRFDVTDGFVGITQYQSTTNDKIERVLLSPVQVKQLISFVKRS